MTKALFRKQWMELFSWLFLDRRTGKSRSRLGILAFGALYLGLVVGMLGYCFYEIAALLCEPLRMLGLDWLYFTLGGLMAVVVGLLGSIFSVYSTLYQAKDNELLLAMPIPVNRILLVRLAAVYGMGLLFELVVLVPILLAYVAAGTVAPMTVLCWLVLIPVMALLILILSCLLGWVVAAVSHRVRHKNVVMVVLALGFIGVYYYYYWKLLTSLQDLMIDFGQLGEQVKGILWPFYQMGLGFAGDGKGLLWFTGLALVLAVPVYLVLSRSFLKLASGSRTTVKTAYRAKIAKERTVGGALLYKEWKRFSASGNYMLNCGLGTVLMPVAAVALLYQQENIKTMLTLIPGVNEDMLALMAVAILCAMISMNDMVAPSVSLEGKELWVVQSLPVAPLEVLHAKLKLQLLLTVPVMFFPLAALVWVFKFSIPSVLLMTATGLLFSGFMALLGLVANLKMPNLNWTSEIVPIKQSMSVVIALMGGWLVVAALGFLYWNIRKWVSATLFLALVLVLLAGASVLLYRWIRSKGAEIFAKL